MSNTKQLLIEQCDILQDEIQGALDDLTILRELVEDAQEIQKIPVVKRGCIIPWMQATDRAAQRQREYHAQIDQPLPVTLPPELEGGDKRCSNPPDGPKSSKPQ